MKIVTLVGKSQHGKNRVFEQGSDWQRIGEVSTIFTTKHRGRQGPFVLLRAMDNKENVRWVSLTDDPDFEIVE